MDPMIIEFIPFLTKGNEGKVLMDPLITKGLHYSLLTKGIFLLFLFQSTLFHSLQRVFYVLFFFRRISYSDFLKGCFVLSDFLKEGFVLSVLLRETICSFGL